MHKKYFKIIGGGICLGLFPFSPIFQNHKIFENTEHEVSDDMGKVEVSVAWKPIFEKSRRVPDDQNIISMFLGKV